jgi:hypothetical protein
VVLSRVTLLALADIQSQPNWMASDETFLEVLLRVSDPAYEPGAPTAPATPADSISTDQMSPLAYLPQKVLNEIVGLIVTNQNTIPVILSDPYQLTLGPNATGHHFDYWRDADPGNGKTLTSAEYAAAWLTHLAKQAQAGEPVDTKSAPTAEDLDDAYRAAAETTTDPTTSAAATGTTAAPTTSGTAPVTTQSATGTPTTTGPTTTAPTTTTTTDPATTAPSATGTTTEAPSTTPEATETGTVVATPEAATPPVATTRPTPPQVAVNSSSEASRSSTTPQETTTTAVPAP